MVNKKMTQRKDGAKEEEGWRDWSSLTEPHLLCIISLFTTLQDFFAFRGVCRSWRAAAIPNLHTMSSQSPILLLYLPVGLFKTLTRSLFDMAHGRRYLILPPRGDVFGYTHGHLIVHVQSSRDPHLAAINLFTGARTLRLPTLTLRGPCRETIRNPYRFRLSSSPSSPGCLAIIQPTKYAAFHFLHAAFYMLEKWKQWAKDGAEDILFFNNRLYVLTEPMALWVLDPLSKPWDLVLLEATSPVPVEAKCSTCDRYLAESDGELLIVCKACVDCGSQLCFIWRWSFESGGGWVAVSNLGQRSLFFDVRGFVGSVPIPESSGFRPNSIYIIERNSDCILQYLGEEKFRSRARALPYSGEKVELPSWVLPSVI